MAASGVKFDANSPAAKKLAEQVFTKIKEIWDPTLNDDAVAQYIVALVARGSERSKVHKNLKGLIGEDTSNQLLDWLLRHVALNKNELTASKAAPAPKAKPATSSAKQESQKAAPPADKQKAQEPADSSRPSSQQQGEEPIDDVEALIHEGMDEEYDENGQEGDAGSAQGDKQVVQPPAQAAAELASSKPHSREHAATAAGRQGEGRGAETTAGRPAPSGEEGHARKARMRSAIEWRDPADADAAAAAGSQARSKEAELAARRARFEPDTQDGTQEADRHRARADSRVERWDGDREQDRDRDRPGHRSARAPLHMRDGDRHLPRLRSRSRSPPGRHAPHRWGDRYDEPGQRGRRGSEAWEAHDRDRDRGHVSRGGREGPWRGEGASEAWHRKPGEREGLMRVDGHDSDRYEAAGARYDTAHSPRQQGHALRSRMGSPTPPPEDAISPTFQGRPQARTLRSAVSLEGVAALDEMEPQLERRIGRVAGPSRLLSRSLGDLAPAPARNLLARLSGLRPTARAALQERAEEQAIGSLRRSSDGIGMGYKRAASESGDDDEERDGDHRGAAPQEPEARIVASKVRRVDGTQHVSSAAVAPAGHEPSGTVQPAAAAAPASRSPAAAAAAPKHLVNGAAGGLRERLEPHAQPARQLQQMQPPSSQAAAPVAAASIQRAPIMQQQPQQQQGTAQHPAGAAMPQMPSIFPGVNSRPPTAPIFVSTPAAAPPAAAAAVPAAAAPAAGTQVRNMSELRAELLRKEQELIRMKSALGVLPAAAKAPVPSPAAGAAAAAAAAAAATAAAAEAAARNAEVDSRSVLVQNLPLGATEQLLREYFGMCGMVVRVTILMDRMTQMPKGSAYVEFAALESKQKASTLSGSVLMGQQIRVLPKPVRVTAALAMQSAQLPVGSGMQPAAAAWPLQGAHSAAPKRLAEAAPLARARGNVWRRADTNSGEMPAAAQHV